MIAAITVRVPQPAWVETKSLNPGATVERSHCVAFPIGIDAAYECGDLRIAHALPSLRVRNDDRTPVLLYNISHAEPRPVVLANVSAPAGGATNVTAKLSIRRGGNDVQVAPPTPFGTIPGDSTRRIALTYDASGDTTGVYPYTFTVTMSVGGVLDTLISSDTLVVVNRKASAFGAGWWIAGYERLVRLPGGGFLWVGGDGSTRRYVRDTTRAGEAYGAAGFERPDSLVLDGSVYVRQLRPRARVEFDANGRHIATKDPLGSVTTFDNEPTSGRLRAIIHPAASQPKHEFFYTGGSSPQLDSVTGPAPNAGGARRKVTLTHAQRGKVTLTHAQRGKVTRIADPDNAFVEFTYGSPTGVVITGRKNRNGQVQPFHFGTNRLVETTVNLNLDEGATTTICPSEIRGLATGGCGSSPLSPSDAVTTVDGPRTDVTDLTTVKVDRFGGPEIVTDPFGRKIRLYRARRDLFGLVTRSIGKNFKTDDALYNANGTIIKLVDYSPLGHGADAETRFQWDPKWERVTQIIYPEGNVVRFGYDSTTGNRIWQEDGRGAPSRVNFRYYTSGSGDRLIRAAEYPTLVSTGDRDSVEYDASGNVAHVRQVSGNLVWSAQHFINDAVGRPTSACTDIDIAGNGGQQCRLRVYDIMDRDSIVTDSGPPTTVNGMPNTPAQSLRARSFYDVEGNLTRVERTAANAGVPAAVGTLTTRWEYDLANRKVKEIAGDGASDSLVYDVAGNNTRFLSRRRDPANPTTRLVIDMEYDALNRLTRRTLPAVSYPARSNQGIPSVATSNGDTLSTKPYPRLLTNASGSLTIAPNTETFTYDERGAIKTANNGDARVTRSYSPTASSKQRRLPSATTTARTSRPTSTRSGMNTISMGGARRSHTRRN